MHSNDARINDLIQSIKAARDEGFGFLPLIGAGMSVASGIPAIPQLRRYLAICIARSLGLDTRLPNPPRALQPRSFKASPWPNTSELSALDLNSFENNLKNDLFAVLDSKADEYVNDASRAAYQEAIGALADWRSSLLFLSRLFVEKGTVKCGAPDDQITDSFFLHVVGGKRPNLGHRMLAQLSTVLGFGTILTVNFDELLEKAFAEAGEPLTVFDVHLNAGLPPARTVCNERSIVKLHGGRYGLRANYSLDLPPSTDDQRHFIGYLCGARVDSDAWRKSTLPPSKYHLLIAGVSVSDTRTQALLETALKELTDLHIYWVCYFPDEPQQILGYFPEELRCRLHIVQHTNYGLLFLQLYQGLSHCLPPSGIDFPALWQLPAPPRLTSSATTEAKEEYDRLKSDLLEALRLSECQEPARRSSLVFIDSPNTILGVSSVVADVYLRNETKGNFVWLDLDDCIDADEMFVWLTIAVARKAGVPDLLPYALNEDFDERRRELMKYMSTVGGRWIIFLNGRDGLGANADRKWADSEKLWELLVKLTERSPTDPDVTFVVSMHSEALPAKVLALPADAQTDPSSVCCRLPLAKPCIDFDEERAITDVANRISTHSAQRERKSINFARFVYALLLFRRIRYPSTLASWMVRGISERKGDRDEQRHKLASEWIQELEEAGIVQIKQGGFAGIHRGLRETLRTTILKAHPELRWHVPELHQCIADWYYKLFLSSDDPMGVFESVYHRCECVKAARSLLKEKGIKGDGVVANDSKTLKALISSALQEAVNTLKVSRDVVLSRGYSESIFYCLKQLTDTFGEEIQPDMLKALAGLEYDVAIEVADFARAKVQFRKAKASRTGGAAEDSGNNVQDLKSSGNLEHARLLNGLRAYELAVVDFEGQLKQLGFPISDVRSGNPQEPNSNAARSLRDKRAIRRDASKWGDANRARPVVVQNVVRILRRRMYLSIAQARARLLANRDTGATASESFYDEAECWYHCATEVLRFLPDDGKGFLQQEHSHLREQLAIALANRDRFTEAHRRLMEARAFLSSIPPRRHSIREVVIDLRLSEIQLIRLARDKEFAKLRVSAAVRQPDADLPQVRSTMLSGNRQYHSLIEAAERFLESAARGLAGQRKNVRWWMKVYELTTKIHEFKLVHACGSWAMADFGGEWSQAEAAVKVLQETLDSAIRIVRLDAFQLARVVESISNQRRIIGRLQGNNGRKQNVLDAFNELCQSGHRALSKASGIREDFSGYPLADDVKMYVNRVIECTKNVEA